MTGRATNKHGLHSKCMGGSAPHGMSNDLSQPEAGSSDHETCGDENPHEANDPLATVDTDDRPHGVLLPHKRVGQSSECVKASAPWLRRQVDDVNPQECREPQACDSCDAPKTHGELWTHVSSKAMQGTPLVVPEMCHSAMDDVEITATSHGSNVERTAQ